MYSQGTMPLGFNDYEVINGLDNVLPTTREQATIYTNDPVLSRIATSAGEVEFKYDWVMIWKQFPHYWSLEKWIPLPKV